MIKPELYNKTVDILYQAYFDNTLKHGDCSVCAVGNICLAAGAPKINAYNQWGPTNASWEWVFRTNSEGGCQSINEYYYEGDIKSVIDATGYTWQELAKIEYAFEIAPRGNSEEDWMFAGLCAVLDVLKDIHQVENDSDQQKRFKQHYQTLVAL